ncbi:MAG: hypothetical protein ABIV48_01315, partial [Pyrinomonadaceae bacterium]
MSKVSAGRYFLLTIVIAGVGTLTLVAQQPDKNKPSQDVSGNARNVKTEPNAVYKRWLDNDVAYIITSEEKKAFKA